MATKKKSEEVTYIAPPNLQRINVRIQGASPLVINKFSKKAREEMMAKMAASSAEKKSKAKSARPPRDYDNDFEGARHRSVDGWDGIPASSFRSAMIDACRTCGLVMTQAKMSVFVLADGVDADDGTPMVKVIGDAPERTEMAVRNETGVADIRVRPMWRKWEAVVCLEFDADMILEESVINLLSRAGRQVGVGEGRPFSKKSYGQGWGTFDVVEVVAFEPKKAA